VGRAAVVFLVQRLFELVQSACNDAELPVTECRTAGETLPNYRAVVPD
jgi:hypothetical protein